LRPEDFVEQAVVPAQADHNNLPPIYPPEAYDRRQQGSVTLRIHVAADGHVTAVDLAESSGYPLLDNAARTAVFVWHYKPGQGADGNPAPSVVDFIFEFKR
jgi:TonB family protein